MKKFTSTIRPFVVAELEQSQRYLVNRQPDSAFKHLENAHVLGQESTYWHVKAHIRMAKWAVHQRQPKEFFGQILRIVGAATKTFVGLVPTGNTGGANISPFKPLPLSLKHQDIIEKAKFIDS